MSEANEKASRGATSREDRGVLANLPRTRPQRATPRRAAARRAAAQKPGPAAGSDANGRASRARTARPEKAVKSTRPSAAKATATKANAKGTATSARPRKASTGADRPAKSVKSAPERRKLDRRRPAPELEPVPSQGYACEEDAAMGAVQPPGGTELIMSAAEIVGELAKAGISTGERLLKDALSRLPLS